MSLKQKEGLSMSGKEDKIIIVIAEQFTRTVGARFRIHGEYSGQEFREDFLEEYFSDPEDERKIIVHIDGLVGYPSSFMDEAFGGIARKFGKDRCLDKIEFVAVSKQDKLKKILGYINKAE